MRVHHARLIEASPAIIEMLDGVVQRMNDGTIDQLKPAPYYARRELITDEVIDRVLAAFDSYLQSEIDTSPHYHYRAQGLQLGGDAVLVAPGFSTMPPAAKRATVELYDELMQPTRDDTPIEPPRIDDGGFV